MLLLAKKYDEEILPWLINGLRDAYKANDMERVNKLLDYELKARNDTELIEQIEKFCKETSDDKTIQPVVRYGDTDSVFACFRFRDNVSLVSPQKSIELFKQIIKFGKELIRPFLIENDRELFVTYYKI